MRIIAGYLGGRTIESPHAKSTHPMSERVRGALFNSLGDIDGLTFLDAFTGSGALAFEAISRGAAGGVALDTDRSATNACLESASKLKLNKRKMEIIQSNCFIWASHHSDREFDLIFADPPYDAYKEFNKLPLLLSNIKKDGLLVVSTPPKNVASDNLLGSNESLREIARNNYGDAELVFYRLIS